MAKYRVFSRKLDNFRWLVLFLAMGASAWAADRQVVNGHVPEIVNRLQPANRLSADTQVYLALGLPLRDQAGLGKLLQELYDPASPNYRHFLTPNQFTEKFGPTLDDYQALI